MQLTEQQLISYEENGLLFIPECFSATEIARLKAPLPDIFSQVSPNRILEKDGVTVRSVFGSHRDHPLFESLTHDSRLTTPARQIIGADVYVHQFKINAKPRFAGDAWSWHQDYIYWRNEDGITRPDLTTAILFLDAVNEFNGPVTFVPKSHKCGVVDVCGTTAVPSGYADAPSWIGNLIADIKYPLDHDTTARVSVQQGIRAPKGPPGSILFFHPNVFHASSANFSPYDRTLVLITYNSVKNAPTGMLTPRPDFLCSRDYTAA